MLKKKTCPAKFNKYSYTFVVRIKNFTKEYKKIYFMEIMLTFLLFLKA